ncbi:MAG: hypothetical protein EP332_01850 [Bacteroidetes bacterium]|nr:MAG: hypothetical protein EP332_01850 [Bacteroidota bacterium]
MPVRFYCSNSFWLFSFSLVSVFGCSPEKAKKETTSAQSTVKETPYRYTRETLSDSDSSLTHAWLEMLNQTLDSIVNHYEAQEDIQAIAVHYCDLNTNTRVSIHPEQKFIPASLLKVPTLVGLLKLVEANKANLSDLTDVPHVEDIHDYMNWEENEVYQQWQNRPYSLAELADIMVRFSDNRATLAILYYIDGKQPGFLEETEDQLQAKIPNSATNTEDIILVTHLSGIYNALYNHNFLNYEHSEMALKMLSNSQYKAGFKKAIPATVQLAHKHGIRINQNAPANGFPIQLHETGIIYVAGRPFILSVMTKGRNIDKQRQVLQAFASDCYQLQLNR